MTKIFLIVFLAGHPGTAGQPGVSADVAGQYVTEHSCRQAMEQLFDDLAAQGIPASRMSATCADSRLAGFVEEVGL